MKNISTNSYKGVRDFYPEDMAIQQYMFDIWSYTAEQYGFLRYDASILEPSELYKAKGAENEEMVNEQTYTFTDRGDREVTLRPEMTPTVARMVAGRKQELSFPVRWYSIPNLFRYERTQRGRLREHWQLNCDIFGVDDVSADIEILLLANQIFQNFGAENGVHYKINVSSRRLLETLYDSLKLDTEARLKVTRLADRKLKMEKSEFTWALSEAVGAEAEEISKFLETNKVADLSDELKMTTAYSELENLINSLSSMGCSANFDPTIVRGFDYYTGIVFEINDLHPENNRAMMGGGRYDNLTAMFGGESITGVGFGFGDVTLRDFLESHNLLTSDTHAPTLSILPMSQSENIPAEKIAQSFRDANVPTVVDFSNKKVGKKISSAGDQFINYVIVLGEDELASGTYVLKNLTKVEEYSGTLEELIEKLSG